MYRDTHAWAAACLLRALAKDVAWLQLSVPRAQPGRSQEHSRYLEALTKRPAMVAMYAWAVRVVGVGMDVCSP
jgi:hypothetical protein